MIKINLTPEEELENPLWYVPDITMMLLVLISSFMVVQIYFDMRREVRDGIHTETGATMAKAKELDGDVARLETTNKELQDLRLKLDEVRPFTAGQVVRYMPLIVVEHLQNLKPDGVWFKTIQFADAEKKKEETAAAPVPATPAEPAVVNAETTPTPSPAATVVETPAPVPPKPTISAVTEFSTVQVDGFGFDNLLIAEFLTALKATQTQEIDPTDARTQVYFDQVTLVTSKTASSAALTAVDPTSRGQIVEFSINLNFAKRDPPNGTDLFAQAEREQLDGRYLMASEDTWP